MLTVKEYEAADAEWLAYVEAMQKPCLRCNRFYRGVSWSGRCYSCHLDAAAVVK